MEPLCMELELSSTLWRDTAPNYAAWALLLAAEEDEEPASLENDRANHSREWDPVRALPDKEFEMKYRLSKAGFRLLCEDLRTLSNLKSSQRTSLETKVLCALFFYACGSYQRPVGVAKYLSQKSCSNYIEEVTQALIHPTMTKKWIKFPQTPAARQEVAQKFFTKYGMPDVVGCIDGSHFKIHRPDKKYEYLFSSKRYHSLNVQMVCDSDYRILSVNPRFGGASHDSYIWENSVLNTYMQSLHQNGETVCLLGDSGYPLRPWMMVPIPNAVMGSPEAHYNDVHGRARVTIENTFGRLKNHWRCLHKDRILHYKPEKCGRIILACCVLYNMYLHLNMAFEDDTDIEFNEDGPAVYAEEMYGSTADLLRGRACRDNLVARLNFLRY